MFINLYGTILPANGEPVLRKGFLEFLDRYKSIHLAILAYKPRNIVIQDLIRVDLIDKAEIVYTLENMKRVRSGKRDTSSFKDGYPQPDLRTWIRGYFHTGEGSSIIISSNPLDEIAADWHEVRLICVPIFKDMNDIFSFDDVTLGSWSYDIRYFIHRLKGKQMKISLK